MPTAETALAKARHLFTGHGGMLRTSNAIRLGVHPRTLYALRDTKTFHIDQLWAARHRAKEIELKPNATLQVKLTVQDLGSN